MECNESSMQCDASHAMGLDYCLGLRFMMQASGHGNSHVLKSETDWHLKRIGIPRVQGLCHT